jgi:hypothetical protein
MYHMTINFFSLRYSTILAYFRAKFIIYTALYISVRYLYRYASSVVKMSKKRLKLNCIREN